MRTVSVRYDINIKLFMSSAGDINIYDNMILMAAARLMCKQHKETGVGCQWAINVLSFKK